MYQLDLRWYGGQRRLYYNARQGWADAKQWLGLSVADWAGSLPRPEKMWRLAEA